MPFSLTMSLPNDTCRLQPLMVRSWSYSSPFRSLVVTCISVCAREVVLSNVTRKPRSGGGALLPRERTKPPLSVLPLRAPSNIRLPWLPPPQPPRLSALACFLCRPCLPPACRAAFSSKELDSPAAAPCCRFACPIPGTSMPPLPAPPPPPARALPLGPFGDTSTESSPPACASAMRRRRCISSSTMYSGASDRLTLTLASPSAARMRPRTASTREGSGSRPRISETMNKSIAWLDGDVVMCAEWMLTSDSHSARVVSLSMPSRSDAHTCSMKNRDGPLLVLKPSAIASLSAPACAKCAPPSACGMSCGAASGHSSSMRFLSVVQKGLVWSCRSSPMRTWKTTKHQLPSILKSPLTTFRPKANMMRARAKPSPRRSGQLTSTSVAFFPGLTLTTSGVTSLP
mmetsp:Transcript_5628/g.17056  ORF Transcript_5628/g.17056 Transcript_5628/m.17056 type:complete len:401 (-) Transcript_5628:366-1568(-)